MREILDSRDELVQSEELPDQEVEISDVAGNKTEKKESVLMDRLMERSHKQALIAFQLEQLISKQGSSDPDVKKYLNTLPPEISEKFGQIIRDYSRQKKQTSFSKHWLLSDFEENEDKPITPEYLGKVIFEGQVGLIPKGKITFEQREAYFVMVCEDPDDYALIYKGRTVDSNRDKKAELSGGSFHNNMSVSFEGKGIDMPVLLAKGNHSQSEIDDIVVHERQHFINHRLFRKFDATERKGGNTDLRAIKDEVLAYIRDGSSGDRLDAALHGELYKHLFADLPTDKQQIANNIIDAVASFIDYNKSLGFLKDQESRAILVYQLAGIPLERFPEWLDAFQRYYSEREKMYTPFYKRGIDHDAIRDTFAPQEEVQDAQKKMRELSKRMLEIRGAASEIIFSLKNTSPEAKKKLSGYREEYDEILEEAKKEAKPLIQNSAVMSHADMSELFKDEKVEENEFGELRETKFTERVKAKVLIAVKDFSQDKIDDISEYINGLSGIKKSDFLQELAEVINDAVESENGGQHCRVSFSETSSFENSFACTINFSVDEEDKKSDIKEASFIVYFHSTKFDLFYDER